MNNYAGFARHRELEEELEEEYPLDFESGDLFREIGEFQDSAARLRVEADFARRNPGFVTTVGTGGGARENELILWNYLVGSAQTRLEHNAALARVAPRWRGELQRNPLLRIKIVGSASSASGDSLRNERVARNRAEQIRRILTSVYRIPAHRIIVEMEGDRLSLADEINPDDPLNMARDRRVALFLFIPGRQVTQIDRVSVPFSSIATNLDSKPNTKVVDLSVQGNLFAERLEGILADGRATWNGPPDSSIGFIQLLTHDGRIGIYQSAASKRVILDFARCTRPFLPCRDVIDAADPLSETGEAGLGKFVRVRVPFRDAPGNAMPLRILDPLVGPATLVTSLWFMVFVLLFGVRRRESFLPLDFVEWRVTSVRLFPGAIPLQGQEPGAFRTGGGQGAPVGLQLEQTLAGATCRLRTRSIHRERLRTPKDECPEIPQGRDCPPLVCTAHVTRPV